MQSRMWLQSLQLPQRAVRSIRSSVMNPEERIVTWLISLGVLDSPKKTICDPEEFLKSSLKNGVVLCKLINRLRPGSVEKVRAICSIWRFSIARVMGCAYFNLFLSLSPSLVGQKSENDVLAFSHWPPNISTVRTCCTPGARGQGEHPCHQLALPQTCLLYLPVYQGHGLNLGYLGVRGIMG